jgi:RNA polymerase sigma-70 factor (ECF subfamily)
MAAQSVRPKHREPPAEVGAAQASRKQPSRDAGAVGPDATVSAEGALALTPAQHERFNALYRDHFDFVFRNLRRLGVPAAAVDDALQEVYLVVLRRLHEYRDRSQPRAWLFAIAARVAGNHRRSLRRRGDTLPFVDNAARGAGPSPFESTALSEAGRVLHEFLEALDEGKRAVFIMAELEQMTAPEIGQALAINVNTVYSRLQAARGDFARKVAALP